jgi:MinD-like ATPase involved in chromosome partitioning or flagellar assembly
MSSIVTFYSYKGGVGRSMALANIAVLLARRGLKVLVVDWDLEAPGLERYFSYFSISGTGTGLLRLLLSAQENRFTDFDAFTLSIDCGSRHPIKLIASGREQDDAYSSSLEAFDWPEFFAGGGGSFFERLREQWRNRFDITLIDSRTGLSDTGGICTIQLPDAVVAMFTANHQSLYGVRDVMRLAQSARQALAYDRMPLSILPLPSRWGIQEFQETQIWLDRVVDGVQEFYADWLPRSISPRTVVEKIKIPHHSYFGFGERLAVEEQGTADPTGLGFVYDKVAAFLASDFKDLTSLIGGEAALAGVPMAVPVEYLQPYTPPRYNFDVFVSYERSSAYEVFEIAEDIMAELSRRLGRAVNFFLDRNELRMGDAFLAGLDEAVDSSKVMLALLTPRYLNSKYSMRELNRFVERKDRPPILPVLLSGDIDVDELPFSVKQLVTLDVRDSFMLKQSKVGRRSTSWWEAITLIADNLHGVIKH